MINLQCRIVRDECKCLSVRGLRKRAENGVSRPNISVVEKKCVVLAIDCCLFSVCFKPASLALFLFRSARLPSLALPSGSFRSLAFRFLFSRFPFPVLSLSVSCSFMRHFPFSHFPFPALPAVSSLSAFFVGSFFLLASSPQRLPSSIFALRRFLKGLV